MATGDNSDILRRLELLENERAILATLHRYGQSIDYGLEQDWVDCFTPDGVFEVRRRVGATPPRLEGHAALKAFVAKHTRAPANYHKHFVMDSVIEIDGDTARVKSYFTRMNCTEEGVPFVRVFGRYRDHMLKGADGRWRFKERIAEVEAQVKDPA